jgi:FkbM family methyltransferase
MSASSPPGPKSRLLGSVYETRQGLFCLDPRDAFVAQPLIEQGESGLGEVELLGVFLNRNSRVLMLGGHIGTLVVPLSKNVSSITVLEANPHTYELLAVNLAINHCENVTHYNLAANHENAPLRFVMNTVNSGGSKRYPREPDPGYFYDQPEIRTVTAVRLDDLLAGETFDMIFMDIEGSEYFAMLGMPGLISRATMLVSEFIPHHLFRVAGIGVRDFLSPLRDFQAMVVPSQRRTIYGHEGMIEALQYMCDTEDGDSGLIFHKQRITVNFQ